MLVLPRNPSQYLWIHYHEPLLSLPISWVTDFSFPSLFPNLSMVSLTHRVCVSFSEAAYPCHGLLTRGVVSSVSLLLLQLSPWSLRFLLSRKWATLLTYGFLLWHSISQLFQNQRSHRPGTELSATMSPNQSSFLEFVARVVNHTDKAYD